MFTLKYICINDKNYKEPAILLNMLAPTPTSAVHAMNTRAPKTVLIIDNTKPAVAIPDGLCFFDLTARIIPIIPKINESHPWPAKMHTIPTIPNTRDGWGQPIYHYECDNCHNLDAGFIRLKDNTIEEKQYFQFVISKYQNIRGFNEWIIC